MKKRITISMIACCMIITAVMLFVNCQKKDLPADLVVQNGKIVTMDDSLPEVTAVAVRNGIVAAIGTDEELSSFIGPDTEVIDLQGKLAVPGFIDAHAHFTGIGQAKLGLDLMSVKNWDEVISKVKAAAADAAPGTWIQGRGWHQEKWDSVPSPNVDGLPFHHELSRISPENPVLLKHASGHSCFANANAMKRAGISRSTPDPPGGEIVRDKQGRPIGIFRETAQRLLEKTLNEALEKRTPDQIYAEKKRVVELADQYCLSKGITSFHDAGASFETIDLYKEFVEKGKLGVRLYVMIKADNTSLRDRINNYRIEGLGNNHLTVRAIKHLADGALGAHGAWLLEPYEDLPSSIGLNIAPMEEIRETARIAIENDFQLNIHCIGDRANREILNIYENAFLSHPEKKDLRWRIEHSQHLHPDDIPRFGGLGVIASMQGIHCTSDGPWVWKRLGEKRAEEGAYMWRTLMETGAVICNGTDAPVEDVDPLPSFHATISRKLKDGRVFYPDQRMSPEEALRSYTLNAAYAGFQEDRLGSLIPGKLADIVILSKDIMTIPENEILDTDVLTTIVGGKILYQKP